MRQYLNPRYERVIFIATLPAFTHTHTKVYPPIFFTVLPTFYQSAKIILKIFPLAGRALQPIY